jgi:hypothetical protein
MDGMLDTPLPVSDHKSRIRLGLLCSGLILAISGCARIPRQVPIRTSTPEITPTLPAPTEAIQGFLEFPYISSDAGNFSLQAGEQITITWVDAPRHANRYEIVLLNQDDGSAETLEMIQNNVGAVEATWRVPAGVSGILEGYAYFNDGNVARSGCCAQVYSNALPPTGICTLRTEGIMPQHLYAQRNAESDRILGIAPGLYLEVLARSSEGWYRVRTLSDSERDGPASPGTTGWLHTDDGVSLSGPCEEIPHESIPGDLQEGNQENHAPAG